MTVLEKEFFLEQFRLIHDKLANLHKGQQQIREEMTIMREQVGSLVTAMQRSTTGSIS